MSDLSKRPGFQDADATFAALVDALEAVGDEGALDLLSRLVLLLAAEVGDHDRIMALLERARASRPPRPAPGTPTDER